MKGRYVDKRMLHQAVMDAVSNVDIDKEKIMQAIRRMQIDTT